MPKLVVTASWVAGPPAVGADVPQPVSAIASKVPTIAKTGPAERDVRSRGITRYFFFASAACFARTMRMQRLNLELFLE